MGSAAGAEIRVLALPPGAADCATGNVELSVESWRATTDREGRFEIAELPPGVELELRAHVDRAPLLERVRLEPGEVRDVVLRRLAPATLRGVVLDADGVRCPYVRLWLERGDRSRLRTERETPSRVAFTGGDGTFEVRGLRPGGWIVGPGPEPDRFAWMTHVEIPAETLVSLAGDLK